ncbi:MAG: hypothetical protein IKV16_02045 [Clostridia bacterium]|nr:hypothetical protein [Clostridia bacterium]
MGIRFTRALALFSALIMLTTVGGVFATWKYASYPPQSVTADVSINLSEFVYVQDMPEAEVSLLERIHHLLNNMYSNDIIPEDGSRQYLLSTLDKNWEVGHDPTLGSFVGSMDPTEESQYRMSAMFGDVIDFDDPNRVSFILKSEDLVGSIDNEIALYSTSDPLTWTAGNWLSSVVGVYLSVFVPVLDENGVTVGYDLLCDSIHGYCVEVQYMDGLSTPSFSTDHWRDELYYWHESYANPVPITGEDRYKYECYHPADGNYAYPGRTQTWLGWINVQTNQWAIGDFMGKKAWQCLAELLESQS